MINRPLLTLDCDPKMTITVIIMIMSCSQQFVVFKTLQDFCRYPGRKKNNQAALVALIKQAFFILCFPSQTLGV